MRQLSRIAALVLVTASVAACGGSSDEPAAEVTSADGIAYTAEPDGHQTRVEAVDPETGDPVASLTIDGRFALPALTTAGDLGGLSHDGEVLALEESDERDRASRLALLHTDLSPPVRTIELDGDFSFDALSPDGTRLFLIEHLPPAGSSHYQVRLYDVSSGRLAPQAIVDKRFPDEQMSGQPLARVDSGDGVWVYTLYQDGARNFVHALQTDGAALCIDLPPADAPDGPWKLEVAGGGHALEATSGETRVRIDLDSLSATLIDG